MSILKDKKALLEFCSTDHWDNVCAFTFNLKQAVRVDQKNSTFQWYRLDDMRSRKCYKEFMRALNRRVYKSAYVRHGKRLQAMAILEKSVEGRYHFHAAIEAPKHMTQEEFCKLAMDVWLEQNFGYGHGDAKANADRGWIDYMAKVRSKDGFDHYFDCLDIDTFHNNKIVIA
jgi:hypothetical protein